MSYDQAMEEYKKKYVEEEKEEGAQGSKKHWRFKLPRVWKRNAAPAL